MKRLSAPGFPEGLVRRRAREGAAAVFPGPGDYGRTVFGAGSSGDPETSVRIVPPVFVPERLEKLYDLGREPLPADVDLTASVGGFAAALPLYVSAFGSTDVAESDHGLAVARQAGRLGVPMVIGENVIPVRARGHEGAGPVEPVVRRIAAYAEGLPPELGGVVVQQSTEDADAEVWNLLYSHPATRELLESGRLGFELKVGQGAKPGLGGMTLLDEAAAGALMERYSIDGLWERGPVLRGSSPGTFTSEILRHQIRLMRNNYPRCRVWVKLPPTRDIAEAAATAWEAGADAVTVDGAEGGTGWAPVAFLDAVGLPLTECLSRIDPSGGCLLVSGRIWNGVGAATRLAEGADAVGLGRAALIAADEDGEDGLRRLAESIGYELRLLTSAVGKYAPGRLGREDLWTPHAATHPPTRTPVNAAQETALSGADRRDAVWKRLRQAMPEGELEGAMRSALRLRAHLVERRPLGRSRVLVAYGGGKDSAYTLAYVRTMQLALHALYGETFPLRIVTMRHAGVSPAVMHNIERSYRALGLLDDPDCEPLLVDGTEVAPYSVDRPLPPDLVQRNREDILMSGHRTFGDGRPTFCNACNISVAKAMGLSASYGDGVDVIITGDSPQEQRSYAVWINRLGRRLVPDVRHRRGRGFPGVLTTIDALAQHYFEDVHGPRHIEEPVGEGVPEHLTFFSIYDETAYAAGDHWDLLTSFLGFEFEESAFNFTESDCRNPALMAHLRALKAERLYQRDYASGLEEYVEFALGLMRSKDIPEVLLKMVEERYRGPGAAEKQRAQAGEYARAVFGLTEEQLVCMVYSPFAERAAGLDRYLAQEQPQLAAGAGLVRELLGGKRRPGPDTEDLVRDLERVSGLSLEQLRTLHDRELTRPGAGAGAGDGGGGGLPAVILDGDPHQAVITTRHRPDGPEVAERVSGR
ncbi:glutamate synthase-related protein [Actinomadura rugatobispora]|uniref:Glutamate synthase-related protein n=1 Tax=Actinomadura rugatobispora TaxID=1994 RepID=A0ABW0ZWA6_9ACTN|nr:hypothetical protein GCM10010200_104000 [Actinomadura rugatobispora]